MISLLVLFIGVVLILAYMTSLRLAGNLSGWLSRRRLMHRL